MRGTKRGSLFILFPFVLLLGVLLLFGCNGGGDGLANPEKDVTIAADSETYAATNASNFTVTSLISHGYSSVSITTVTCVNGECETCHFEREEAF
jgi:hypothetical protein